MGSPRRLSVLRAAALALSATGAVLMGYSGATGAAIATPAPSAAPARPAVTGAETREHRCATATPEPAASRHHRDETTGCDGDAGREHGAREHDSRGHAARDHDGRDHAAAGHHASGVAAGQAPTAGPSPAAAEPGGAAGAAGRTTPPDTETTTTTSTPSAATRSARAGAVAGTPAVPVTGVEDTFGAGLLLCLAGLFALLLARRR